MVKGAHDFTFAELAQKIRESRGGKEVKLAFNTTARFLSSTRIAIRLYSTDIIIVSADNIYQLSTDGHDTTTTKDRIGGFSPVQLKTVKGVLCVMSADGAIPFCDGIKVNRAGVVVGGCCDGNCKTASAIKKPSKSVSAKKSTSSGTRRS